jgi:hypothetical protein
MVRATADTMNPAANRHAFCSGFLFNSRSNPQQAPALATRIRIKLAGL